MDLIEIFPSHVVELIFNQLTGSELIKCARVKFSWNKAIGSSSQCMNKIDVRIGKHLINNRIQDKSHHHLIISNKIRHVRLCNAEDHLDLVMEIFHSLKILNSLVIVQTEFKEAKVLNLIMTIASKTIESLSMYNVSVERKNPVDVEDCDFKNLKSLKVSRGYCELFLNIFEHCTTLECLMLNKFEMYNQEEDDASTHHQIAKFLEQNKSIKMLHVDGSWLEEIFTWSINLPYELEDFSITNYPIHFAHGHFLNNFYEFLGLQKKIRKLQLGDRYGAEYRVFNIALKLPVLEQLTAFFFMRNPQDYDAIELPSLSPVKRLDILAIDFKGNYFRLEAMLRAFPLVEHIKMRRVNEEVARFMRANLPQLKELYVVHIDSDTVKDILPNVTII